MLAVCASPSLPPPRRPPVVAAAAPNDDNSPGWWTTSNAGTAYTIAWTWTGGTAL